jgi:hypothetical protein
LYFIESVVCGRCLRLLLCWWWWSSGSSAFDDDGLVLVAGCTARFPFAQEFSARKVFFWEEGLVKHVEVPFLEGLVLALAP